MLLLRWQLLDNVSDHSYMLKASSANITKKNVQSNLIHSQTWGTAFYPGATNTEAAAALTVLLKGFINTPGKWDKDAQWIFPCQDQGNECQSHLDAEVLFGGAWWILPFVLCHCNLGQESLTRRKMVRENTVLGHLTRRVCHNYLANWNKGERRV